jgi:DNA-binding MarR family transcriptional regulator
VISLDFSLGLAAGLVIAGSLYLVLRWWARRTTSAAPPTADLLEPPATAGEGRGNGLPALLTSTVSPPAPPQTESLAPVERPVPVSVIPSEPVVVGNLRPVEPSSETRGRIAASAPVLLSQRVILHVYSQGNLPPGAVAPPGLCQSGIGEALGITQGGLAAVLRRLEAAGILTVERGHVQGRDRRLKIYRLSSRGLEVAQELRGRPPRRPGVDRPPRP